MLSQAGGHLGLQLEKNFVTLVVVAVHVLGKQHPIEEFLGLLRWSQFLGDCEDGALAKDHARRARAVTDSPGQGRDVSVCRLQEREHILQAGQELYPLQWQLISPQEDRFQSLLLERGSSLFASLVSGRK